MGLMYRLYIWARGREKPKKRERKRKKDRKKRERGVGQLSVNVPHVTQHTDEFSFNH